MKKLVVFDWGGVIEKYEEGNYTVKDANLLLLRHMGVNFDEISEENAVDMFVTEIRKAFTLNDEESLKNWYKKLAVSFNTNLSYYEFEKLYKKYYEKNEVNENMVELIYETKKRVEIALLSNMIKFDRDRLEKQIKLDQFDYIFLSYKLDLKKPDINIYKYLEQKTNRKPEDILFIDDTPKNIKPAIDRGWNTICESGYNSDSIKKKILEFTN